MEGESPENIERMFRRAFSSGFTQRPDLTVMGAFSGLEIACWDILGKDRDRPEPKRKSPRDPVVAVGEDEGVPGWKHKVLGKPHRKIPELYHRGYRSEKPPGVAGRRTKSETPCSHCAPDHNL